MYSPVIMEELERTYLVKELPSGFEGTRSEEMLDIYIPSSVEHPVLRIRKTGEKYEITKKEPFEKGDASHQIETTIPLTKAEYAEFCKLPGKRVQKTRFTYQENKVSYEIDIFRGDLEGLVLVDVEFSSLEEKDAFVPPTWCLAEVTQEKFLAGGIVCGKKYSDIETELQRFNYKRLKVK